MDSSAAMSTRRRLRVTRATTEKRRLERCPLSHAIVIYRPVRFPVMGMFRCSGLLAPGNGGGTCGLADLPRVMYCRVRVATPGMNDVALSSGCCSSYAGEAVP
ncbi:hypothetical protein HPB50_018426 [Hyalomma asiaticum]|uniref:Uncharacterized protein n=1 Tax=Hyalomma asiaticum TaxID=266040 RepID=A0ACB7TPP8_HYAAI|nr:hypothetical protein HPB50_018426 [Hyalomma asiaticum]